MLPDSDPTLLALPTDALPMPAALSPYQHERRIKSFVRRAGRTTSGQQRALREFSTAFTVPMQSQVPDWHTVFGRTAALILEIGSGMGETTAHIAQLRPQDNFVACEVHPPGVGALLQRIHQQSLSNLRIVQHDAVLVLRHMIADYSLAAVHIFFPDPWHKKRHHKRRLVQRDLVQLLCQKLVPGGTLHLATDWPDLGRHMLQLLSLEPQLRNLSTDASGFCPRPEWRCQSKFEMRGLRLGHPVVDLTFMKT